MNLFDQSILEWLNQFARSTLALDYFMNTLVQNKLLKGGFVLALVWWAWFQTHENQVKVRLKVVSTMLACLLAILVGRVLALNLPFRLRPMHLDDFHFKLPYTVRSRMLEGWSSFPSDHAILFYTLGFGLLFISRKAGYMALAYITFLICLPRIYLGLHYPTDILAGCGIGLMIAMLFQSRFVMNKVSQPILDWSLIKPGLFYALFFLLSYQVIDLFDGVRGLIRFFDKVFL